MKKSISILYTVFIVFGGVLLPSCETYTPNNLQCEIKSNDTTSSYICLYNDMVQTISQDISNIITTNGDINKYSQEFYESYFNKLSPLNQSILYNNSFDVISTTRNNPDLNILSNGLFDKFAVFLLDSNINTLHAEIAAFYNEPYFLNLNYDEQSALKLQLEALKSTRDSMVNLIVTTNSYQSSTRMSPGDRMIWSECASQMTDSQRENFINIQIFGIGLVCAGPAAIMFSIVEFIKNVWEFGTTE